MKKLFFISLLSLFATANLNVMAQTKSAEPVAFWGKEEAYLLKQAAQMFSLADQALTENPPVVGAPMARKLALYNLDAMLHEVKYDNSLPFCDFIDSRIGKVIEDMKAPVKKGVKIYKIYNDGFVARTKSIAKTERKSAVFGDSVPGWVDYILLVVVIAGIGACIFIPALRRKKKTKELYARLAAEGYLSEEK